MVSERSTMNDFPFSNENASSPFFLHNGDNPGTVLVSQILTGDNFSTWRRSMEMALTAKNKIGFLDGSIPKPSSTDSSFSAWTRCNTMVLSWILNSISAEIANSVIFIDSAAAMWSDLQERFSQSNGPRIFQLRKKISVLAQGNNSVSAYYTQLKGLWDELLSFRPVSNCSCGGSKVLVEHHQQEYVFHFLMGLNESFANIRGQILLVDPLPPINKVFSLVIQEERQRELCASSSFVHDTAALLTKTDHSPSNSYPKQSQFCKPRPLCSHCGLLGHTIEKCCKLHGHPPGYEPKPRPASAHQVQSTVQSSDSVQISATQEQCQQLLALLKLHDVSTNPSTQASSSAPPEDHIFSNMTGNIQTFTHASCPLDKR